MYLVSTAWRNQRILVERYIGGGIVGERNNEGDGEKCMCSGVRRHRELAWLLRLAKMYTSEMESFELSLKLTQRAHEGDTAGFMYFR